VSEEAASAGISEGTLRRAKKAAGIEIEAAKKAAGAVKDNGTGPRNASHRRHVRSRYLDQVDQVDPLDRLKSKSSDST
jgi:hypothetical protein